MPQFQETITAWRGTSWTWLQQHAKSKHVLPWLALVSFVDPIFSPVAAEVFLVALMLAHPKRWAEYLVVAIAASTVGAAVTYCIGAFLFTQFGGPMLHVLGLQSGFVGVQHFLRGHVFWAMVLANFTLIPDKLFIYAGGFLGVHFTPFIAGYFTGRGVRMAAVTYLTGKFGKRILDLMNRYLLIAVCVIVAAAIIYGMVHLHVFGL